MVFAKANTAPRRRQVQLLVHDLQSDQPAVRTGVRPRRATRSETPERRQCWLGSAALWLAPSCWAVGRRLFGFSAQLRGPRGRRVVV